MVPRARLHGALVKRPEASSSQGKAGALGSAWHAGAVEQTVPQQPGRGWAVGRRAGVLFLEPFGERGVRDAGEWEAPGDVSACGWVVTALGVVESLEKS